LKALGDGGLRAGAGAAWNRRECLSAWPGIVNVDRGGQEDVGGGVACKEPGAALAMRPTAMRLMTLNPKPQTLNPKP